ncbi:MAG: DinB family protein [Chloroflexota bacterium]
MFRTISKPEPGEFAPYTSMYIDLLPNDGLVLTHLQNNVEKTIELMLSFPEGKLIEPHLAGEWTIKEIMVHIIDDERIYAYRALRFGRNDQNELPGFEQDEYVPYSKANQRTTESIIAELRAVRAATVTLFNSFTDEDLLRKGIGSGNVLSVRAAAYHIAGHELHHLNSIQENYGHFLNN